MRSASTLVEGDRLWARLMAMAQIGRVGESGVNRAAFSPEDIQARRTLIGWASELGLSASHDAAGNLFLRLEGLDKDAPPVLVGSHLDSQPAGGRFDGVYGVIAGLEAVEALLAAGMRPARPVEVVAWSNEEGGRFAPGAMGSQVFAGVRQLADFLGVRDAGGITLQDALHMTLATLPEAPVRAECSKPAAYLEAHIEQGPVLERLDRAIAVVDGIQGCQWLEIVVTGEATHAGTTPIAQRRDALVAAMALMSTLRERCFAEAPDCRFTVGRLVVEPNTPNTVPGRATFTVDFRHPDHRVFARMANELCKIPQVNRCEVQVRELFRSAPVSFPLEMVRTTEDAVRHESCEVVHMTSGAFHDALFLARCCPVAMVFVRCRGGISHNPNEYATPEDLTAGTRALTRALEILSAAA